MQTKSVYAALFYANCQMQAGLQWKYKFICAPQLTRQNHNETSQECETALTPAFQTQLLS